MARKRAVLKHRKQRSILTDMLPFEVPPTFSNRGFYRFLRDKNVSIVDGQVQWEAKTDSLDATMALLFGLKSGAQITVTSLAAWGKARTVRSFPLKMCRMDTIPFNFKVSHNLEGRILSVVHPRSQIRMADFYAAHSASIIYYTNLSEFSIRRPVSVSRFAYYNDKLHEQTMDRDWAGVEIDESEYEQLGSYFVYRKYRNIHQFFESYKYHRSEKKYGAMIQIDVSKCFDSIYTHSIGWAIVGKPQTKFHLAESKETFAGRFDILMQSLNHNETNGIVIGPEFSRIFAEIILQSVDRDLQERLLKDAKLRHKVDYEIFRYVDDFFVFYNEPSTQLKVIELLQDALKAKKLSINSSKIKIYEQPIITEISVAKERVSSLLNDEIDPRHEETTVDGEISSALHCYINSNRLIVRYKSILKETKVSYSDLLNYTLAILEKKLNTLIQSYRKSNQSIRDKKELSSFFVSLTEF